MYGCNGKGMVFGYNANYGGAVYNVDCNQMYVYSHITSNDATSDGGASYGDGGGIYAKGDESSTLLWNSTLTDNLAYNGGGLCADGVQAVQIGQSHVSQNRAMAEGGGLYAYSLSSLNVENSHFYDNQATSGGGISACSRFIGPGVR